MVVMAPKAAVYQERYLWSRRTASVVAAGVLAVLVGIGVAMLGRQEAGAPGHSVAPEIGQPVIR